MTIRRRLPNFEFSIAGYGPVVIRNNPDLLTTRELGELVITAFGRAAENGQGND